MPAAPESTQTQLPAVKSEAKAASKTISVQEYSNQMSLSLAQLETVTLMLQTLDQLDNGGQTP